MFGAQKYGYQPDIITSCQGPDVGLLAARRGDHLRPRVRAVRPMGTSPSRTATPSVATRCRARSLSPTLTFSSARICSGNVLRQENSFRQTLERLYDLPIVGDVRGDGYFYAVELVKDKATKETLSPAEVERVLRGYVAGALFENGLYCRTDDRGDAVVQVAPR